MRAKTIEKFKPQAAVPICAVAAPSTPPNPTTLTLSLDNPPIFP